MSLRFSTRAALVSLSTLAARGGAAQTEPYSSRIVDRPQTLPARTLRFEATFDASPWRCVRVYDPLRGLTGALCQNGSSTPDTSLRLRLGASYGVSEVFEVGATLASIRLTPDATYTDPGAYLRWEIAHHGRAFVSLEGSFNWLRELDAYSVRIAAPVWYRFSPWVQVQTGFAYAGFLAASSAHGISLPLRFNFTFTDHLYGAIGGDATAWFGGFGNVSVTFGLESGYAFTRADDRPMFDLVGQFRYEPIVGNDPMTRAAGFGESPLSRWVLGLTGRFYLAL